MKVLIAILAMVGAILAAHADDGANRTFEITVREVFPEGKAVPVGGPLAIVVQCGRPAPVQWVQETNHPTTNPPQTGQAVALIGYMAATGCKP